MRWFFPAILLALITTTAPAARPLGAPSSSTPNATSSGWCRFHASNYWGWWQNGVLQGRWHPDDQTWEEWTGSRWLPPSAPPWSRPDQLPGARRETGGINYGLETSKLAGCCEHFWIGGEKVSQHEFEAVGDPNKDDSKLPQVLVLDPDKRRREEAYAALTTSLAGKARVNAADPTNKDQLPFLTGWKLDQDERFKAAGVATYIQGLRDPKDGCAPVVSAVYQALPAAQLAAEVGARVNPAYDPAKNPSGSGSALSLNWKWLWDNVFYPLILILLGGGAGVYAMKGDKPKSEEKQAEPEDYSAAGMLVRAVEQYKAAETAEAERLARVAEEKARVKEAILALAK